MEQIEKLNIYDDFHCIAGDCQITCCQEWKIAVDDDTFAKWKGIPCTEAELGKQVDHNKKLSDFVTYKDEARVVALQADMKCPFLNNKKLCRLVVQHGDQVLSKTCQLFPRQINEFDETHKAYALMASCPAVIDLLQQQSKLTIEKSAAEQREHPFAQIRDALFDLIQDTNQTIEEVLQMGFIMLLELLEASTGKSLEINIFGKITDKSYQNGILKTIRKMKFQPVYTFEECNELFLDVAENYREQKIYTGYLEPIAELAEEYCEEAEDVIEEEIKAFLPQLIPFEQLGRKYLATEMFANLYLPDYTFEDIIMAYEWIAMEYVTIRHTIFLQWKLQGKKQINYEQVNKAIVMVSRMTGYDAEDMQEYLENSFEEPIWEWGYLGLITGKR